MISHGAARLERAASRAESRAEQRAAVTMVSRRVSRGAMWRHMTPRPNLERAEPRGEQLEVGPRGSYFLVVKRPNPDVTRRR